MAQSTTPDYYEILGVSRDADADAITRAYRRLAHVSHPDGGGNAGMFRLLRTAYETLTDEAARRRYDAGLDGAAEPEPEPEPEHEPEPDTTAADATPADADVQTEDSADGTAYLVEPERLSWWPRVDAEAREVVVPPFHHGRSMAAATAATFLVIGVVMTVVQVTAVVLLVGGGCMVAAAFRRAQQVDNTTFAAATGFATLAGAGLFAYSASRPASLVLVVLALCVLAGAVVCAYRYGRAAFVDRLAPPAALVAREFGHPGGAGRDDESGFAERVGADALLSLTLMPGVRIFHDLDGPAADQVVSHAITCGRLVGLVESRSWEPGAYGWSRHGALLRNGQHFPGGDLGIDTTLAAYRQLLGETVQVRGFVLVVPSHAGDVVGPTEQDDVVVGGPQTVVESLGEWFLDSGHADVVDRSLLLQLHGQLVTADEPGAVTA